MEILLTLAQATRLLGVAIIMVAIATIINSFSIHRQPEYTTIIKIEPNLGYCDGDMTYFSDGGGVCGYVAPVGMVVDADLLRKVEKQNTQKLLVQLRDKTK